MLPKFIAVHLGNNEESKQPEAEENLVSTPRLSDVNLQHEISPIGGEENICMVVSKNMHSTNSSMLP